jgi:hypothetical protein
MTLVATEGREPDATPAHHGPPGAASPPLLASAVRGAGRSGPGARGRTVIRPGDASKGSAEAEAVPFGIDALVRQTAVRTADVRVRRNGEGRRAGGLRGRAAARRVGGWLLHTPAAWRAPRERIATLARVVPVLAGTRAPLARQTLCRDREWTGGGDVATSRIGRTATWRWSPRLAGVGLRGETARRRQILRLTPRPKRQRQGRADPQPRPRPHLSTIGGMGAASNQRRDSVAYSDYIIADMNGSAVFLLAALKMWLGLAARRCGGGAVLQTRTSSKSDPVMLRLKYLKITSRPRSG